MVTLSPQKLAANRLNGQKGGVKTEAGKTISKYNALKHGILSKEVLLDDEDSSDLNALGKKLRTELAPDSELELVLVDRITANVWRLRRVMQVEREMMYDDVNDTFGKKTLGGAFSSDFSNHDTYGKLIRYEASIERGIYKALHELQRLQAARRGELVPVPGIVDVDISGDKELGFVS